MKGHTESLSRRIQYRASASQGQILFKKAYQLLFCFMIILALLSTTGCMGLMFRSMETGEKYSELKTSIPPIPSGLGRLYVYVVGGGPNVWDTSGSWGFCTVDENVYRITGDTYWYIDLEPGKHRIADADPPSKFSLGGWHYGNNYAMDFDLNEDETKYYRISYEGFFNTKYEWTLSMVESSEAEQQLENLDFFKNFKTNRKKVAEE